MQLIKGKIKKKQPMYELILMDLFMHGQNGLETTKEIRAYLAANLP